MLRGCPEYRQRLIELARGTVAADERRVLMAHVQSCADCARVLDGQWALSSALGSMAAGAIPEMAEIETLVLAEFDRAARRPVVRMSRWALVAGLAAAVLLGLVWVERRQPAVRPPAKIETAAVQAPAEMPVAAAEAAPRRKSPVRQVKADPSPPQPNEESQPFLTIPYTVPLSPEERTTVVRMEIPVAALIAAGYSVPVSDPGATLEADVLVSEDGRARAIRPVAISASK